MPPEPNSEGVSNQHDPAEPDPSANSVHSDDPDLAPVAELGGMPREFGRYRILRKLGQGAMGEVFLAEDKELNRRVALKTPAIRRGSDGKTIKRFLREARSAATIHHPNVCPVYDLGECEGRHFLTMKYIEGCHLAEWVRRQDEIPTELALRLVQKIALGLQAAHDAGLVHRDLKPANVMMSADQEPIIMDFGMVRLLDVDATVLTPTGAMTGTPAYMAPEQVLGNRDHFGPTTDLYSLGVIMYELLTGSLPFSGSLVTLLGTIVSDTPPPLQSYCSDLDPHLDELCQRALIKEQADRYQSGLEMASAIEAYVSRDTAGSSDHAKPANQVEQPVKTAGIIERIVSFFAR
jgi:serine/threonine protein kinase